MDTAKIAAELSSPEQSAFHKALLEHCKQLVTLSRNSMSARYKEWDDVARICNNEIVPDVQDEKAKSRGEPGKLVVPVPFAQINTFIAFCFAMYYQRERFFELVGRGSEDVEPARLGEALLDRDLQYNKFPLKLYQFLYDIARFGVGVMKVGWVREISMIDLPPNIPATGDPLLDTYTSASMSAPEKAEVVRYLGNRIYNISPYRFFPDPRFPLARFQEGEFCASEDEYTLGALYQMEREGLVHGVKYIKSIQGRDAEIRQSVASGLTELGREIFPSQSPGTVVLTECQVALIPAKFKLSDGEVLGPEEYPVKYNVWYVNDNRVIKCEPLGYAHGLFTYDVAEYNPDFHNFLNPGLAGAIGPLASVVSWLVNSHIASVRKTIENRFVVDPTMVKMEDFHNRSPVIRVKEDAARMGVDKFIKQLEVRDYTSGHIADARELFNMVQLATGINDNALGQFHTGRRSATEARSVNSASATRLKVIASLIWYSALVPLAEKMLSNLREGLDVETVVRVAGEGPGLGTNPGALGGFVPVTKDRLVGNYDIDVFDGTLPSERMAHAQTLSELLQVFLSNPQAAAVFGFNVQELLREVLLLRGIKNPERFMGQPQPILTDDQTGTPQPPAGPAEVPGLPALLSGLGGA